MLANLICESDRNCIDMTPYYVARQADEYLKTQISALTSPNSSLCEIVCTAIANGDRNLLVDTAEMAAPLHRYVSALLQDEFGYMPYSLLREFRMPAIEIALDDLGAYISELRRSLRLESWSQVATRLVSAAIGEYVNPVVELTAELVDTVSQLKLARERYPLPCHIEVEMKKRVSGILANCRRSIYVSLAPRITDIIYMEFEMLRLCPTPSVAL